jgi:hypothetical protein
MEILSNALTKGTLSHQAWWSGTVAEFLAVTDEHIVSLLNLRLVEAHYTARADQVVAWRACLPILRGAVISLPTYFRVVLEYPLLRLGRRLDVVLLTDRAIFVLEFKTNKFDRAGRTQAEDYALDLRDFHAGSRHQPIVPILVAAGTPRATEWPLLWPLYENPLFEADAKTLKTLLLDIMARIDHRGVDIDGWEAATYRPVPTIIEAATMLYRKHGVADIKSARAETTNLTLTTDHILAAIKEARDGRKFIIVFITGIPGAGKTLCGLNAIFSTDASAAFLTGTLPMVYVLRQALTEDAIRRNNKTRAQAAHETKAQIQSITGFLRDHRDRTDPPAEQVIVFDEAQRAWDAEYGAQKFNLADSEAGIVLDIMRRHQNFAVVVGLVGTGQEINTGEAGLAEWGKALSLRPDWQVWGPPNVLDSASLRQRLFQTAPPNMIVDEVLHLNVPIRQIRSAAAAPWVDAVLRGATDEAAAIAAEAPPIPFFVTRSLPAMRRALRRWSSGSRRAGLVCSSGAKRLVADGLWPKFDHMDDGMVGNWFLKPKPDVRGSDALEIPATEFACQGLEMDYVGLCWGGDMIWHGGWVTRSFSGTKWHYPKRPDAMEFCRNTYRVLFTRARYATIIWIPAGDPEDITREPALFDQTTAFLLACGAQMLPDVEHTPLLSEAVLF